eukprot:SAG31_NODE_2282_length_6017_cov_16.322237_6_plen_83_part_00
MTLRYSEATLQWRVGTYGCAWWNWSRELISMTQKSLTVAITDEIILPAEFVSVIRIRLDEAARLLIGRQGPQRRRRYGRAVF